MKVFGFDTWPCIGNVSFEYYNNTALYVNRDTCGDCLNWFYLFSFVHQTIFGKAGHRCKLLIICYPKNRIVFYFHVMLAQGRSQNLQNFKIIPAVDRQTSLVINRSHSFDCRDCFDRFGGNRSRLRNWYNVYESMLYSVWLFRCSA